MNLQEYYSAIRNIERSIPENEVWICSIGNRDGGVDGRITEVSRRIAARMIVEGHARLAATDEVKAEVGRLVQDRRRSSPAGRNTVLVCSREDK